MEEIANDWVFGGKVAYIKPLPNEDGYFGATMMLEGMSKRKDSLDTRSAKVICFLSQKDYRYLSNKGAKKFDYVEVGGHFETWLDKKGNNKDMKIADFIMDFQQAI